MERKPLDLSAINFQEGFPSSQYYRIQTKKNAICIHHTVSGPGVMGDIGWWNNTPARIATPIIIDRDGIIHQIFNSGYWAHHLGVKTSVFRDRGLEPNNVQLNQATIGIELDSWGGLVEKDGQWITPVTGAVIPKENVIEYNEPYRGYKAYEKYTDAQIESCRQLLEYFCDKYGISMDYNEDIWDVTTRALSGQSGIYTHTSYRPDKSDCHPQLELKEILQRVRT